jgi:hypothetical protein
VAVGGKAVGEGGVVGEDVIVGRAVAVGATVAMDTDVAVGTDMAVGGTNVPVSAVWGKGGTVACTVASVVARCGIRPPATTVALSGSSVA